MILRWSSFPAMVHELDHPVGNLPWHLIFRHLVLGEIEAGVAGAIDSGGECVFFLPGVELELSESSAGGRAGDFLIGGNLSEMHHD